MRVQVQYSEKIVDKIRSERTNEGSRMRSLEEITKKVEGVGAGVRSVMTRFGNNDDERAAKGVLGLVADRIECPEAYPQALAGALGERLQHVVVRDVDAGLKVLEFLEQGDRGRATAVPR